jgi:hypothetical protein
MERVRSVTRLAGALAPAVFLAAGCVAPEQISKTVTDTVNKVVPVDAQPAPATQVLCFWQRRLTPLPDPTREGAQTLGLPGQLFLITPDNRPAEANGDLAVYVFDETPRPPGSPALRTEVWHYTKDVLKRLAANDERFGKSYALFLPWPAHWRDVTVVKISARYQSPGDPALFAGEVKLTLDPSTGPVWQQVGEGASPFRPSPAAMTTTSTVTPDPNRLLREARAGNQPAQAYATPAGQPAGGFGPGTGQPHPAAAGFAPAAGGVGSAAGPGYPGNAGVPPPNWPPAAAVPQVPPPAYQPGPPTVQPPGVVPQYQPYPVPGQPAPPANGPLQPIIIPRPAG